MYSPVIKGGDGSQSTCKCIAFNNTSTVILWHHLIFSSTPLVCLSQGFLWSAKWDTLQTAQQHRISSERYSSYDYIVKFPQKNWLTYINQETSCETSHGEKENLPASRLFCCLKTDPTRQPQRSSQSNGSAKFIILQIHPGLLIWATKKKTPTFHWILVGE